MRSRPAPVSMLGRGSGSVVPSAARLYCMKTRFQISTNRSEPAEGRTAVRRRSRRPCRRRSPSSDRRVRCPPSSRSCRRPAAGCAREERRPSRSRSASASSSLSWTVIHSRSPSMPRTSVTSSQAIGDGLGLEVVAEAEVAQHLEEGAVAVGGAHDVDVHGPEALLHRGGPLPRRHLVAQEEGLERHHTGDGEQHRGVVGDEAGRGHGRVPPLGEEAG